MDKCDDIGTEHQVRSLPTFLLFVDKEVVARIKGADMETLRNTIQEHRDVGPRGAVASWGAPAPAPALAAPRVTDKIDTLVEVIGVSRPQAEALLEAYEWNVEVRPRFFAAMKRTMPSTYTSRGERFCCSAGCGVRVPFRP